MLPLLMLAIAVTGLVCVGIVKSKSSVDFTGNYALVNFTHAKKGLMVKDKYGYLKGFEIAGADKKFHYAKAIIDGNNVIVFHDDIANPVAVRFGWADDAKDCNLYNSDGFPAGPFRTDNWKGITENAKYVLIQ